MVANDHSETPLLDVRDLGREYGDLTALHDFNLEVRGGQAVALVGHNGSGKTTALTMMAGRLDPTEGTVHIGGVDAYQRDGSATVRSLVSFIPDAPALYSDLTVSDHLDLIGLAHGVDDVEDKAEVYLERFRLAAHRYQLPRELSRGMRQKTQLACGLLRPFALLMLDEPVAGLDPPSRQTLRDLLAEAKREGAAVVFSTHQLDFAHGLVDRVVVLDDGVVAVTGSYDEVVRSEPARELGLV